MSCVQIYNTCGFLDDPKGKVERKTRDGGWEKKRSETLKTSVKRLGFEGGCDGRHLYMIRRGARYQELGAKREAKLGILVIYYLMHVKIAE